VRRAVVAAASVATVLGVGACSTTAHSSGPSTATPAARCQTNPADAAVPTAESYRPVPDVGVVSVSLSGVRSGVVKPDGAPTEVDLTVCNDSPVSYPKAGFALVLQRCGCAPLPGIPSGTVKYYQPATDGWIAVNPVYKTQDVGWLTAFTNVQPLPKGQQVTLRYRISLDTSMTDGAGGVTAAVLNADGLTQIGAADLPFTVSTAAGTPAEAQAGTATNRQSVLPFKAVDGLAVDAAGNVYVSDNDRVLRLANGSGAPTVLPFSGLQHPGNVTVDAAGNVYVTDYDSDYQYPRVVELSAGSDIQTVLPPGRGSFVGADGGVYAIQDNQVVKFAAGSSTPTVLAFTGLKNPDRLTVDPTGNVYLTDGDRVSHVSRVVKLSADGTTQTDIPVTGLDDLGGLAVDAAGNVYLSDGTQGRRVVKISAGDHTQTVLPFTGLNSPSSVAVDAAGGVYVLDHNGFGRVVKLAADR
jgi:sugar lactone lactonase YvrE